MLAWLQKGSLFGDKAGSVKLLINQTLGVSILFTGYSWVYIFIHWKKKNIFFSPSQTNKVPKGFMLLCFICFYTFGHFREKWSYKEITANYSQMHSKEQILIPRLEVSLPIPQTVFFTEIQTKEEQISVFVTDYSGREPTVFWEKK